MSVLWFLGLCLFFPLTYAALKPLSPGPGDVFRSTSACTISWDTDSTKTWRNVTIYLMSGSNLNMSTVIPVVEYLDGTDSRLTTFHWKCPDVTHNAAIYFYQFTNNEDWSASTWSTRFTIASPSGVTTPPENSKQPGGDPILWGVGHLLSSSSTGPSKSMFSPRNHPPAGCSSEALGQRRCVAPLEDALASSGNHNTLPALRRSSGRDPVNFTQETSRGSREGGPAMRVQFVCGLTTLLFLLL